MLLEVCSRKVIYASKAFKSTYSWEGQTIPYKLISSTLLGDQASCFENTTIMSDDDIDLAIRELIECSRTAIF